MVTGNIDIERGGSMANGQAGGHTTAGVQGKARAARGRGSPPPPPPPARITDPLEPTVLMVARVWPGITAVVALVLAVIGFLTSNGFIDPVAHRGELSALSARVADVEKGVGDVRGELKELRTEMKGVLTGLARIEGKLTAGAVHKTEAPRPIKRRLPQNQ